VVEEVRAPEGPVDQRDADADLMAAFLRQDRQAAAALYDRFASRIYGLGITLLRNPTDAEDLVQDTFLKIWRKGATFDPVRGSLEGWILLMARSLAIDLLRRRSLEARKLASEPKPSEASEEPGPERQAEVRELFRLARGAMDDLPVQQRSALELVYLGEHSSTQVARLQGIPPGTVKSRVRAGIATLRETFPSSDDAA
jgi:RNA polymerase sigma-70 factor, ECF subfamily